MNRRYLLVIQLTCCAWFGVAAYATRTDHPLTFILYLFCVAVWGVSAGVTTAGVMDDRFTPPRPPEG